jgi:hypothetical protein
MRAPRSKGRSSGDEHAAQRPRKDGLIDRISPTGPSPDSASSRHPLEGGPDLGVHGMPGARTLTAHRPARGEHWAGEFVGSRCRPRSASRPVHVLLPRQISFGKSSQYFSATSGTSPPQPCQRGSRATKASSGLVSISRRLALTWRGVGRRRTRSSDRERHPPPERRGHAERDGGGGACRCRESRLHELVRHDRPRRVGRAARRDPLQHRAHTYYLRGKIAAEHEASAIARRTGLAMTSIHPGLILGPRFCKPSESVAQIVQFVNQGATPGGGLYACFGGPASRVFHATSSRARAVATRPRLLMVRNRSRKSALLRSMPCTVVKARSSALAMS